MNEKEKNQVTEFRVTKNGPLHVKGNFRLLNSEGHEIKADHEIYLCRCGHSQNKPFCDGSHRKVNFQG